MKLFRNIAIMTAFVGVLSLSATLLAQGPKMVQCFNKAKGLTIEVPAQAAEHLHGHGGWFCSKVGK